MTIRFAKQRAAGSRIASDGGARRRALLVGLVLCASCTHVTRTSAAPANAGAPASSSGAAITAFVDVTVIPMDAERVLPHQAVVVEGGRISALGPRATTHVPPGAARVDGRGKFLLPGLADMQVHMSGSLDAFDAASAERQLFLFVANGVTTVRNMYGNPEHLALRVRTASGELLGPRIYTATPVDASSYLSPAMAESIVTALQAAGYDFLKLSGGEGGEAIDSLAAAGRAADRWPRVRCAGAGVGHPVRLHCAESFGGAPSAGVPTAAGAPMPTGKVLERRRACVP